MAKAVKLADIASALNVSTVTVSKALSGQKGVSEEMREKIIQVANELGYKQSSSTLRTVRNQNSYYVGILIPEKYMSKYDSFYWQMYQELATKAVKKECFTMLEVLSDEDTEKMELPKLLKEQKVDGMIVIGRPGGKYIEVLRSIDKIPLLYLDFFDEVGNCDAVITNSFYGTYMLTNYLFKMGHTKIGYVGTLLSTGSITDRYFGYAKSLLEHGQEVRKDWIIEDRDVEEGMVGKGFKIVFPKEMPTAFVCNCDLTASEVIKRLKEYNLSVPEDVSVVGFDNFLFPGLCDVPITTYEVDTKEMVRKSLQILIKKIRKEYTKAGVNVVEGQLIIRNSVKNIL